MGKKRKMRANPQKYGNKFRSHPVLKTQDSVEKTVAEVVLETVSVAPPVLESIETVVEPPVKKIVKSALKSKSSTATKGKPVRSRTKKA
jgi:hypothetical protein|tara:strand:- start:6319 stop:6585 length:267 start_codon:yes stop_codon:yes gene_type:complete